MASKLISTILWTLASVNLIALVLGGLVSWLGYAIPVRLRQFGLSPELTQMAGFAALLIACLGLCALNYSSHYALSAYGLSCATSIVFMLFGMIPDSWQQSINEQQSSSLQHQLNYVNYTSTLTGKGLLSARANGAGGRSNSGLMLELIYFALLVVLTILLIFAFILGQYFRRQELEEAEQQTDQTQPHQQEQLIRANSHAGAGCCNSANCTCDLGAMFDANLRSSAMPPFANTITGGGGRQRLMQVSAGQLDHRAVVDRNLIRNPPRRSSNCGSIMHWQPISMITRDASNQPWTDASGQANSSKTNGHRDNILAINSVRGRGLASSRSLVSLTNDVMTGRRSFAGDNRDNDSNDEDNDANFETIARQKQHQQQQPLEHRNNHMPPLIHRGFYYRTMKDSLDYHQQQQPRRRQRHQEHQASELVDTPDASEIYRSGQPVNYHHNVYNKSMPVVVGVPGSRSHKRQQQLAGHQNNSRDIRCRCDLQSADGACNSLDTYYSDKSQCYNTMPSRLSLSNVYAIESAPSSQRLAVPNQKRSKPSGGSSVMAVTAAAAAALLGGVTGSSLMDVGGPVGAGGSGGSVFDSYIDDGMPTDVMGDSGLEMTSSLGQHTGCDVDLFDQHEASGQTGLEPGAHRDASIQSQSGFHRCVNTWPDPDLGPMLELNTRHM